MKPIKFVINVGKTRTDGTIHFVSNNLLFSEIRVFIFGRKQFGDPHTHCKIERKLGLIIPNSITNSPSLSPVSVYPALPGIPPSSLCVFVYVFT